LVKTDRSRYIYLYMASHEDKLRWSELAKKANLNLSKYAISVFENAIANDTEAKPRGQLVKELGSLRNEIKNLREDLKQKSIVIEKYEADVNIRFPIHPIVLLLYISQSSIPLKPLSRKLIPGLLLLLWGI
jgi:hypothetical protein